MITGWILIVTLYTSGVTQPNVYISEVYTTRQACLLEAVKRDQQYLFRTETFDCKYVKDGPIFLK